MNFQDKNHSQETKPLKAKSKSEKITNSLVLQDVDERGLKDKTPDTFASKISQQQQVGNAVPPLMAQEIAKSIVEKEKEK